MVLLGHVKLDFRREMAQAVTMAPSLDATAVANRIWASAQNSRREQLQLLEFCAMSTVCRILHHGLSAAAGGAFQQEALAWIARFETRYSRYVTGSLVAQINAAAGHHWVAPTPEDDHLFNLCAGHFTFSGGLFDVTALPLIQLWDWKKRPVVLPDEASIQAAKERVDWNQVQRRPGGIFLPQPGMAMDLGGIGKEYAVDKIVELAQRHGIANVLVDFGQDVRGLGQAPAKAFWSVGLEDPKSPGRSWALIAATRHAVATSGDYQRHFEANGRRYGHVIDLRTGRPADTDCRAASIIAPTCAQAGWLATAVCVLGSAAGLDLVESQPDCAAAVVTDAEKLCTTRFLDFTVR